MWKRNLQADFCWALLKGVKGIIKSLAGIAELLE